MSGFLVSKTHTVLPHLCQIETYFLNDSSIIHNKGLLAATWKFLSLIIVYKIANGTYNDDKSH